METTWLEDFVVLAENKSFSRAAVARHITQPALSRRIQALENWIGLGLVNRSVYPLTLTAAGEHFYTQAQDLLVRIGTLKLSAQDQPGQGEEVVTLAMPHTVSLSFFPAWLHQAQSAIGSLSTKLHVGNALDSVLWMVEGGCDVLICYHHPQQPLVLDAERYDMRVLGQERLAPYSVNPAGGDTHAWPGKAHDPTPFLAYTSGAYMSRMVDIAIEDGPTRPYLKRVCVADLAEGLRRMAIAGLGTAFLPESLVKDDVLNGRLFKSPGKWDVTMEIRAYRERPSVIRPAPRRAALLWDWIELTHPDTTRQETSPPSPKTTHNVRTRKLTPS